jgi:hypothetical protein
LSKIRIVPVLVASALILGAAVGVATVTGDGGEATTLDTTAPCNTNNKLTISSGGTYTGSWCSTDTGPAVTVTTTQPVTIEGCVVKGRGHGISIPSGANVTVRNCYAEATWSGTSGSGRFVWAGNGVSNLTMENNEIHRFAGLKVVGGTPQTINVKANKVRNIQGDPNNCCGFMQFAQFDNVRGGAVVIAWNEIINQPNVSRVEDVISFFGGSGGTNSGNRWKVFSNLIWGAWNEAPATMPGFSGGGIMHGDANEQGEGWIETYQNYVLGTGNYGISVAGGTGHWVHDNTIVRPGRHRSLEGPLQQPARHPEHLRHRQQQGRPLEADVQRRRPERLVVVQLERLRSGQPRQRGPAVEQRDAHQAGPASGLLRRGGRLQRVEQRAGGVRHHGRSDHRQREHDHHDRCADHDHDPGSDHHDHPGPDDHHDGASDHDHHGSPNHHDHHPASGGHGDLRGPVDLRGRERSGVRLP